MTKPKPKEEPPPDVPGDKEEAKMEEASADQPQEGSSADNNDKPADKQVEDMDVD